MKNAFAQITDADKDELRALYRKMRWETYISDQIDSFNGNWIEWAGRSSEDLLDCASCTVEGFFPEECIVAAARNDSWAAVKYMHKRLSTHLLRECVDRCLEEWGEDIYVTAAQAELTSRQEKFMETLIDSL